MGKTGRKGSPPGAPPPSDEAQLPPPTPEELARAEQAAREVMARMAQWDAEHPDDGGEDWDAVDALDEDGADAEDAPAAPAPASQSVAAERYRSSFESAPSPGRKKGPRP